MDKIENHVNDVFRGFPRSEKINKLRDSIKYNMEDRYIELLECGKSEVEAFGIVVQEFGDVDELLEEINGDDKFKERNSILDKNEGEIYAMNKRKYGIISSIGILLIFFSISLNLILEDVIKIPNQTIADYITVAPMIILIAIAMILFIYAGYLKDDLKYYENGEFENRYVKKIKREYEKNKIKFTVLNIIAVLLFVLSPCTYLGVKSFFIESSDICSAIILIQVGIGIFIATCTRHFEEVYNNIIEKQKV